MKKKFGSILLTLALLLALLPCSVLPASAGEKEPEIMLGTSGIAKNDIVCFSQHSGANEQRLWRVLSPVGAAIAKWVLIALMILAALAVTVKTVFPKTPLKKIFNKYTLLWVLGGSTAFCIADVVLQRFYPDMPRLFDIARAVASAALLIAALIPVLKHEKQARDKQRAEEDGY